MVGYIFSHVPPHPFNRIQIGTCMREEISSGIYLDVFPKKASITLHDDI